MLAVDGWTFFLLALASFRITRLIVFDRITEFIRRPFFAEVVEKDETGREEIFLTPKSGGLRGFFGELLDCYWCTGFWVSLFLILLYWFFPQVAEPVILVFALAGAAAIIEIVIGWFMGE